MLRKMLTNTLIRKLCVFSIVFVIAAVSMGSAMLGSPDHAAEEASQEVFVLHASVDPPVQDPPIVPEPPESIAETEAPPPEAPEPTDQDLPAESPAEQEAPVIQSVRYEPPEGWSRPGAGFVYLPQITLSEELQAYTYSKCEEQGISYSMVLALMWRESRFQAQAVGYNTNGTSDSGLMQINDVNREWLHRELAIDNLLDPYQNIDAGIEILARFQEKHGEHGALMAYQYGEAGMRKKLEQGVATNRQIEMLYEKRAEFDEMLGKQSEPPDSTDVPPPADDGEKAESADASVQDTPSTNP